MAESSSGVGRCAAAATAVVCGLVVLEVNVASTYPEGKLTY